MSQCRDILSCLFWRVIPAGICIGTGFFLLILASHGAVHLALVGFVVMFAGALIIASPLANFLAEYNPLSSLFYPEKYFTMPPPIYSYAQACGFEETRRQGVVGAYAPGDFKSPEVKKYEIIFRENMPQCGFLRKNSQKSFALFHKSM